MPSLVLWNVVILGLGYAHVHKEVRRIPYAPIVVQVLKVAIIIVLMELLFVKDNLTLETQKLALEIVIHILPIQSVPVQEERRLFIPLDAPRVARDTKVATISVKMASLFVKERVMNPRHVPWNVTLELHT